MTEPVLLAARTFLSEFLRGKENPRETLHPWRKVGEATMLHSYRVEAIVLAILEQEPHTLSQTEITLLRLAALLHDIGRLEDTDNHARLGAEIAARWLQDTPETAIQTREAAWVCNLIAAHSEKDGPEANFACAVLKDADSLDEIGAMSIFMAANWLDRQSPFYFKHLLERLQSLEIPYCEQKQALLFTKTARKLLSEKQAFIEVFISQLSSEMKGTI
jgi:uncharacterized protein